MVVQCAWPASLSARDECKVGWWIRRGEDVVDMSLDELHLPSWRHVLLDEWLHKMIVPHVIMVDEVMVAMVRGSSC